MDMSIINKKLDSGIMQSSTLLSRAKFIDISSKESAAFNDPRYFPFYYYLGSQISTKKVCQIGSKLGLIGLCFLQGNKTVENWLVLEKQIKDIKIPFNIIKSNFFISGNKNVELNYINLSECNKKFELCMLTEKYNCEEIKHYLEYLWSSLSPEGLLVVDYIQDDAVKDVFFDFCRVKNREPMIFNTRYGVGILTR